MMESIDDKNNELISVIIPTYNRCTYFKEALMSALRQSLQPCEIIVTDNNSNQRIWKNISDIIKATNSQYIHVRRNQRNVGPLKNLLKAVNVARGEYLAVLHDDDVWEPTFLERLVPPLKEHPGASLAFSDHYIINQHGQINHEATKESSTRWNRNSLSTGMYQPFCKMGLVDNSVPAQVAAVIRKSAIQWQDFPEKVRYAHDLWLTYLACRDKQGAYYVNERLTRYRVHDEMLTATAQTELHEGTKYCYEHFLKDERLAGIRDNLADIYRNVRVHEAFSFLKQGNRKRALGLFRAVLAEQRSFKVWIGLMASFMPKWFLAQLFNSR